MARYLRRVYREGVRSVLKKMKTAKGFSLGETMVAVAILVIISASALPTALKAYQNAVDAANAQVVLSTAINALRGELSTAWDVHCDGTTITYNSAHTGDTSVISIKDEKIMLLEYSQESSPAWWGEISKPSAGERPLLTDAMRQTTRDNQEHMKVYYTGVTVSDEGPYVTITGLVVKRGDVTLAEMPESGLVIRVMSVRAAEPAEGGDG